MSDLILRYIYYKSKACIIYNNRQVIHPVSFHKVTRHIRKLPMIKESIENIENELKIFKKTTIETLKSSYYEGIGIV